MGRAPLPDSVKLTESITIGLNRANMEALEDYATKTGVTITSAIRNILEPSGCFSHKVSDEEYEVLKNTPEKLLIRSGNWIPAHERKTFRSRVTKEHIKSLFYEAIRVKKTSPVLFVRNVIEAFLESGSNPENPVTSDDILVKKIWQNVSEGTKKELLDEYQKARDGK